MTVSPAPLRDTVQVRFPDGQAFNGPVATPLEEFVRAYNWPGPGRIVAALVNGHLRELSLPVQYDVNVVPVTTADSDGGRIYRRSLSFLLVAAATEIFPTASILVEHSLPFGGYYCERLDEAGRTSALSQEELQRLKARMNALAAADLPLRPVETPLEEALELFRAAGDINKEALFARRRKDYLKLYELNGIKDYMHGFMVPSTGYLDLFDLLPYASGFILQFPRRHEPERLLPLTDEPRLASVFQEYANWLRVIGVPYVAALNRAIEAGRSKEVILTAEAFHQRQLTNIAANIAERRPDVKLVLISGPTSAGKTTFSKRLAVQLMAEGIHPVTLALDDYFVSREKTPRDEAGDYDFEHFDAVDHVLFQQHLVQLIRGETIMRPNFNFYTGQREVGGPVTLRADQILLVEGIHALNARLVQGLPLASLYRIYVSAFTQLNLDQHNRVPTTDTRLLRRIVRDAAHRGYSAADTIARWPSVRRGEKHWIFPNEVNADVFFNSALVYELAALKPLAYPLLLQVEPGSPERIEANRLLAALQWYAPVDVDAIPSESLLREFIGGSIFADFKPWAL